MTGRGRGRKRKSEDFICEINDEDLSPDEDEDDGSPSNKMSKIDGELIETSNTEETSNDNENKSASESIISLTDKSSDFKVTKPEEDLSTSKHQTSDIQNPKMNTVSNVDTSQAIEINDNCNDADKSVIIIEDHVSIMVVSDDEEEGEITEDLQVIDEVTATPQQKSDALENETPETANTESVLDEFRVIEEVGPSPMPQKEDDVIKISFKCDKTMSQYGHLIEKFFESFPELEVKKNKLCMNIKQTESFEESRTPKKRNKKKKKAKKDLFVVDTNPSSNDDNSQFLQFRYTSKFEISEQPESEDQGKASTSSRICFNCDGDHALRDCNIPKNMRRINQARQQFLDKYKTVRYHVDPNDKLADLKPGVISENLRSALGLNKNEIPHYIYRMRSLGYPPGWLEEAKVSPSDLNLFNIDGKKVESMKANRASIDPSKIIEYPGFNTPPKKGCYDDFKRHKVPPYTNAMHKSSMIKYYEDLFQKEKSSTSGSDSEVSQKNVTETKNIEKPEKNEAAASVDCSSLVDLEEKKKELLDELNTNLNKTKSNDSEDASENTEADKIEKEAPIVAVKNTELGTPILKSSSPYARLPNPDNFSVGVSPVIDFENLPNSTGKYEELSKVLSKVRMTMKNVL